MKRYTKEKCLQVFENLANSENRIEYFIDESRNVLSQLLEADLVPNEMILTETSMNFYLYSDDISSMDNLPNREIWLCCDNDGTNFTTEERGTYFSDRFFADRVDELKEFLNGKSNV